MVLGVCRQVLGDAHDVEDAFQATFLVLLRKAGSVRNADSVASWLHGVAYRVSRRAKAAAIQRRAHERRGAEMRASRDDCEADSPESWTELHEEIARLPARYREPLVLCYLEGLTTGAVAQRLRCPQGTILSRLSRGRERLRARLTRRGLAPVNGLVTRALPSVTEATSVPGPLLSATIQLGTQFLEESVAAPVSASVASLTEGVLQAMFWTKLKASGLVGLALATLAVGAGAALAYQEKKKEGRVVRSPKAPREPAGPVVKPPDAAKPTGSSAAAFVPLPLRGELHQLLRRASSEAVALARAKPMPSSWCLTTIARAQAMAGDLDGARATFADAAKEAEGAFGGAAYPWNVWRVGHFQAECGLKEEARATLQRAVKAMPGVMGDHQKDSWTVRNLAMIVEDQAKLGAREDARKTVELLLEFSKKYFESSPIRNARDVDAPQIAAALAAAGNFEAAFRWSEGVDRAGNVLGEIAEAASKCLDRESARRFVREAAERLAKMQSADETYFGLSDLAEAQARLGDVEAAKRLAKAIGEGPSRAGYDMTDGQPYALIRVAGVQRQAGDTAGAKDTLRDAFRSVSEHSHMRGRDGRYLQITYGQIANGDFDGAAQTVGAMEGERSEPLASLARAYAAVGDETATRTTFARALIEARRTAKDPPSPNPELAKMPGVSQNMPAAARMGLAEIQAMAGDVPGALKTVRSIDDQNYQRFALERVVSARATAGDVAGALRLGLDESKTPEERRSALEGLGRGLDARFSLKSLTRRAE
jgi:RNA polymerase sigma factor (sigma-70 family)